MNLSYENPALVEQLLIETGQRANLMAITCHQLLTTLQPNQRLITSSDVERALHSDKTLDALKGWDAMTDNAMACQLDRIVVFATINEQSFDLAWLVNLLNSHGLTVDGQLLDSSLARLTLGFILGRTKDRDGFYFFRVPLFRQLILRDSPEVKLQLALKAWS